MRRRQARRDGDFVESLHLFRELLEIMGESIRSCYVRDVIVEERDQKSIGERCQNKIIKASCWDQKHMQSRRASSWTAKSDWSQVWQGLGRTLFLEKGGRPGGVRHLLWVRNQRRGGVEKYGMRGKRWIQWRLALWLMIYIIVCLTSPEGTKITSKIKNQGKRYDSLWYFTLNSHY